MRIVRRDSSLRPGGIGPPSLTLRDWLERVDDRFMGSPIDVHPHDALLHGLRVTAGEVAYCDAQIRRLSEDELFERPMESTTIQDANGAWVHVEEKRTFEVISRWVQLRDIAIDRMAKLAKMALDAGIEERQIKLAERQASMISEYLEAVLDDIQLTPDQRRMIGPSLRKHLPLVEGNETQQERA